MTLISVTPGNTEVQLTARGRANKLPPALTEVPGGLYPMKSAAFEVDEYRLMAGWPVPVPECDVTIQCMVSAEGDILTNRDAPTALVTAADMRWVADSNYYDQITGQWSPIQGRVSAWETTPDHAPTLVTDYEYTVADERFISMSVLNFDSDTTDYMSNNLSMFMGGTMGYTVIMVLSPNSIYGNDTSVNQNALLCPDSADGAWTSFTVRDQSLFMTTESSPPQLGVPLSNALSATAPTFLAMVVHRPYTRLYAASGPSNVQAKTLASGATPVPLSTSFWLGKSVLTNAATIDMALFDLSIYGNPLSRADVVNEFATLATVYGGDT